MVKRNLGVSLDEELSLSPAATDSCGSSGPADEPTLTRSAVVTMVNNFVVSRIDYCNSLLAACSRQQLDKLQRVLNCVARVIYGGDHARQSSAARQTALAQHQSANNIQVVSLSVQCIRPHHIRPRTSLTCASRSLIYKPYHVLLHG